MDSKQPLVSVIIPFLNHSDWLIEAIQSVVTQNYTKWELIVIDDGSEPHHSTMAKNYCLRFPAKIKYSDHEGHINKGVTISRNVGISKSSGTYIAFLDADDIWLPDKLKCQVDLFNEFPASQMICEASRFWYSWNNTETPDKVIKVGVVPDTLYQPPLLMKSLYPLGEGAPPCPSAIIIRKSAIDRCGGFEPAFSGEYTLYEDQAFLAKIYLNEAVYISGATNNLYRKRSNSMSSAGLDVSHYKMVRKFFLDWLQSYLSAKNNTDKEIKALICHAYETMAS